MQWVALKVGNTPILPNNAAKRNKLVIIWRKQPKSKTSRFLNVTGSKYMVHQSWNYLSHYFAEKRIIAEITGSHSSVDILE